MCNKKHHHHHDMEKNGVELLQEAVHVLKHIERHLDQISDCVSRWDEEEEELLCLCDEEED